MSGMVSRRVDVGEHFREERAKPCRSQQSLTEHIISLLNRCMEAREMHHLRTEP